MDIARMNTSADEEHATSMLTGPQPDMFPGPGWMDNWTETGMRHFFLIPHGEEVGIAPFIQYDFDMPYPELLATRGRGCTVHSKPLHAQGSEYDAVVGYTPHEEQMFFEDEEHTDVVDWAVQQEEDPTLQGELQYLCMHPKAALHIACRIAKLCEELELHRQSFYRSSGRLANANAHACLYRHISRDLSSDTSTFSKCKIRNARCSVEEHCPHPVEGHCDWCGKEGHKVTTCYSIGYCCHCKC